MGTTGTQLPPEQKVFGGHHADGRLLIKRPGMRLEYELWRFPTQSPQAFQVPQTAQTRMKASIDNYANVRATRDTGAWVFAHKVANVRSGGSEWRLLSGGYVSCGVDSGRSVFMFESAVTPVIGHLEPNLYAVTRRL